MRTNYQLFQFCNYSDFNPEYITDIIIYHIPTPESHYISCSIIALDEVQYFWEFKVGRGSSLDMLNNINQAPCRPEQPEQASAVTPVQLTV